MKSQTNNEFIWVLKDTHKHIFPQGLNPYHIQLNNEFPPTLQQ